VSASRVSKGTKLMATPGTRSWIDRFSQHAAISNIERLAHEHVHLG
jgi:hypothetical protein